MVTHRINLQISLHHHIIWHISSSAFPRNILPAPVSPCLKSHVISTNTFISLAANGKRTVVAALSITLPSHFPGFASWPDLTANIFSHCSGWCFSQWNTTYLPPSVCPNSPLQSSLHFRAVSHSGGGRGNFGAKPPPALTQGWDLKCLWRHEKGLITASPLGSIPPPGFTDNSSARSSCELKLELLLLMLRGWMEVDL